MSSWDKAAGGPETGGLRDYAEDLIEGSGSAVGQRRTQMLSGSVWRTVIVLQNCDPQTDNTVTRPTPDVPPEEI